MQAKYICSAILSAFIAVGASAQPKTAAAPAKADPAILACVAKNKALDAEVDKMMVDGKKAGNVSPTEDVEYKRIEALIKGKREKLAKDGFSLADCQSMTASYEKEKGLISKMVADKKTIVTKELMACVTKNKALDAEIDKMMVDGKKAGNVSPTEEVEYKRIEALIKGKREKLAKDGFSLAECQSMTASYEKEKGLISKMVADKKTIVTKELMACVTKNKALDTEVDKMMAEARKAGNISKGEESTFVRMENWLKDARTKMAKDGFSLADCQTMTKAYESEKAAVTKMAADQKSATAALDACWKAGADASNKNRADMKAATDAKKITPDETAKFKASQENIAKIHNANKAAGYTLAMCTDLGKVIAEETKNVAQWVK